MSACSMTRQWSVFRSCSTSVPSRRGGRQQSCSLAFGFGQTQAAGRSMHRALPGDLRVARCPQAQAPEPHRVPDVATGVATFDAAETRGWPLASAWVQRAGFLLVGDPWLRPCTRGFLREPCGWVTWRSLGIGASSGRPGAVVGVARWHPGLVPDDGVGFGPLLGARRCSASCGALDIVSIRPMRRGLVPRRTSADIPFRLFLVFRGVGTIARSSTEACAAEEQPVLSCTGVTLRAESFGAGCGGRDRAEVPGG